METDESRILVDCGLFQGSKSERELNYGSFPFRASAIDAMILTHAHIDHSGLVPKLMKHGFSGAIHATSATVDLCSVMLPDSAHIQELEVEQLNRRNAQRGRPAVTPIYTKEDAADCMLLFRPEEYKVWFTVAEGVRARFWNAGHLLGSASVELEFRQSGEEKPLRVLFSGDIGPRHKLLQPDPEDRTGLIMLFANPPMAIANGQSIRRRLDDRSYAPRSSRPSMPAVRCSSRHLPLNGRRSFLSTYSS